MTIDMIDLHPLSQYAAKYWWQHAQAVDCTLNRTISNLAKDLLMDKSTGVLPWVQLYNVDKPWKGSNLSLTMKDIAQPRLTVSGLV